MNRIKAPNITLLLPVLGGVECSENKFLIAVLVLIGEKCAMVLTLRAAALNDEVIQRGDKDSKGGRVGCASLNGQVHP